MFVVLFEDGAAMTGLIAVLVAQIMTQATGMPVFDAIGSLLVGVILATVAIWLAWETKGLLIGESANRVVVASIRGIVSGFEGIRRVNEVLTVHMGPDFILVNLSAEFEPDLGAGDIERTIEAIDAEIKREHAAVRRVFIEVESRRAQGAA